MKIRFRNPQTCFRLESSLKDDKHSIQPARQDIVNIDTPLDDIIYNGKDWDL